MIPEQVDRPDSAKIRAPGRVWRYIRSYLAIQPAMDSAERVIVLNYVKEELRLAAFYHVNEGVFRDIFTKYGGAKPEGSQSPEILDALKNLREAARELFRRHSRFGPIPPEGTRTYVRWHEYYHAYDEAVAAELAVVSGYLEGATPDVKRRDRLFEREQRLRQRAAKEQARLCERSGLTFDEFRRLTVEAELEVENEA